MDNSGELKMAEEVGTGFVQAAPRIQPVKQWKLGLSWLGKVLQQFWLLLVLASLGTVFYLLITRFVFLSVQVDGHSMVPSLEDSGSYWVNRLAYIRSEPRQFDIVALKDPRDGTLVVKRIIALPGQSLFLHQGKVYVDGKRLDEPYLMDKTYTFAYERKSGEKFVCVGKNDYFVMGDNRNNSTDSRTFGTVPRADILGRVIH
jgi:signal peptidase I